MNKKELVDKLQDNFGDGYTKKETARLLDSFIDTFKDTLREGEDIKIYGMGTFSVRHYDARMARNPQTNEPVRVPPRKRVHFKPSKTILRN